MGNGPGEEVPHLFVVIYDAAKMGLPREVFVAALRAEGMPVGTGYVRPMYANPTFLNRIAYGSAGCPWTCRRDGEAESTRHTGGASARSPSGCSTRNFCGFTISPMPRPKRTCTTSSAPFAKSSPSATSLAGLSASELGNLAARGQGRIGTESARR